MAPIQRLSGDQLHYLTELDHRDHMAWGAVDPADPDERGLGIARYVRLPDEPEVAEAAVAVIDEFQTRGLGTILLGVLSRSAMENGIRTFRAYVLEENAPMLGIIRDLGAVLRPEGDGLLRVEMPLPWNPDDLPDTPVGRVFKAVAREMLPPLAVRFVHADLLGKAARFFSRLPHLLKEID
jgi:GNAT superfamily N-acetyltransferase